MLTKRNSIKLPQNTKYPAQRAAFIHLLRVYVGAEIYSVSHKHSIPLLLKGRSTGSRHQWAGEALTHPKGLGHPACPEPPPVPTASPGPAHRWNTEHKHSL